MKWRWIFRYLIEGPKQFLRSVRYLLTNPVIAFTYLVSIVIFLKQSENMVSFTIDFSLLTFTVGMLGVMIGTNMERDDEIPLQFLKISRKMIISGVSMIFALFLLNGINDSEIAFITGFFPQFASLLNTSLNQVLFWGYLAALAFSAGAFSISVIELAELSYNEDLEEYLIQ